MVQNYNTIFLAHTPQSWFVEILVVSAAELSIKSLRISFLKIFISLYPSNYSLWFNSHVGSQILEYILLTDPLGSPSLPRPLPDVKQIRWPCVPWYFISGFIQRDISSLSCHSQGFTQWSLWWNISLYKSWDEISWYTGSTYLLNIR